jgi:hypothetical protein
MKLIPKTLLACATLFLLNCSDNQTTTAAMTAEKDSIDAVVPSENPEPLVKNQVNGFLQWYKANFDTLSTISLVTIPDTDKSFYSVNFGNTEEYLKVLKQSGFLTKKFIEDKRAYFQKSNERMHKEKQKDGPPIGLEHDLILLTQDIDNTLPEIDKVTLKNYTQSENTAHIDAHLINQLTFTLVKENDRWLIDNIALANNQ